MNIFISVGTQLPFNRLLQMVDEVIGSTNYNLFYQIGESTFRPTFGTVVRYLEPLEYTRQFEKCDIFISHAGMGSIITALEHSKNIIVVPRKFDLGEHRNDHQAATISKFVDNPLVHCAESSTDILRIINNLSSRSSNNATIDLRPDERLVSYLKSIIDQVN